MSHEPERLQEPFAEEPKSMAGEDRRSFHDLLMLLEAVRLPLFIFEDGELLAWTPEDLDTLASLHGDGSVLDSVDPVYSGCFYPQHVISVYGEHYIHLVFYWNERICELLIGPFKVSENAEAEADRLVRKGLFHIKQRSRLRDYFKHLPRLEAKTIRAVGQVLIAYFEQRRRVGDMFPKDEADEIPLSPEGEEPLATVLPDSYYRTRAEARVNSYLHPSYAIETELCDAITAGDFTKAVRALQKINALDRALLAGDALRSLKNSLIGSMTIFTRAAIAGGVQDDIAFTLSDAYIRQIEAATVFRELIGFESRAIQGFISLVNEEKEKRYSRSIQQVMSYIEAHLTEVLDRTSLAELVHLHPAYLSLRFKQETGMALNAYIRSKRLEEAARMLRYSPNSIADIARFLRFSSPSYFSACFKSYFGCTPGEWSAS